MADVTIYGIPQSTYVRTVRMACQEKGVDYELDPLPPQSDEIKALCPTGKVPALRHDGLTLFETDAITRYLDEAFGGPALQPSDLRERAEMNKWMSYTSDAIYDTMIREIVLPRIGVRDASEQEIQQSAKVFERELGVLDERLQSSTYLAGDDVTLADLFLFPIMHWIAMTPEGQAAIPRYAAVTRWQQAMADRASAKDTVPPMPGG